MWTHSDFRGAASPAGVPHYGRPKIRPTEHPHNSPHPHHQHQRRVNSLFGKGVVSDYENHVRIGQQNSK